MGSLNKVFLIGYLGRDAEVRYTSDGSPVATISIATSDVWRDKQGQKQERTEWHRIVLWGEPAEKLKDYLVKGKQIHVEGALQTRKWKDKDGNDRYTTEIKAFRVTLLGSGGGQRANEPSHPADEGKDEPGNGGGSAGAELTDDDIPF